MLDIAADALIVCSVVEVLLKLELGLLLLEMCCKLVSVKTGNKNPFIF
jgi:hypothetical protein